MWRPKLVVRYSKHGAVSSPTSTAGVVAFTAFVLGVVSIVALLFATADKPVRGGVGIVIVIAVFGVGRTVRDAWAWFAATPAERNDFRQYVSNLRLDEDLRRAPRGTTAMLSGAVPGPRGPRASPEISFDWSNSFVLGLAAVTAACFALIRVSSEFIVAAMFSLALLVVVLLDRARKALRARR